MTKIPLITKFKCEICNTNFNNLRSLSQHIKVHKLTSLEYTLQYLVKDKNITCKCGCGSPSKIYSFKYEDYHVGHNPSSKFWQLKYDKDSEEFKYYSNLIADKVKKYYKENPKIVSESTRKLLSDNRKIFINNNPEIFYAWLEKMKITKQQQSESGLLSGEHHYTSKLSPEETNYIKLKRNQTNANKSDLEKIELYLKRSKSQKEYWEKLPDLEKERVIQIRLEAQRLVPIEKKLKKYQDHSELIKKYFKQNNKLWLRPMYNKDTIPYIENVLNEKYNTKFIHAETERGEFKIYDKGEMKFYFADAYSEELNMWIEFDEPNHFRKGILKEECQQRETRIRECLPNVTIIRIYFDKKLELYNSLSACDSPLGGRLIVE